MGIENRLHTEHRKRMRRRLLETGEKGFSNHELMEMLLFYALPRVNTNEHAHMLLLEFGSLSGILRADPEELAKIKGISAASASFIKLLNRLCTDYTSQTGRNLRFSGTDEICSHFQSYFISSDSSICLILNMDMQLRLINTVSLPVPQMISGELTARKMAGIALKNGFCNVAAGINHHNSPPIPTESDYKLTKWLSELLRPLGTQLTDVIICGCGKSFSMRRSGAFSFGEV